METVISLRNFSYYTSSETVFIHGTVLIKKPIEINSKYSKSFEDVEKGSKVSFKLFCDEKKEEKISLISTESILRVRSTEIHTPESTRFNQFGITYIAEEISKCEI